MNANLKKQFKSEVDAVVPSFMHSVLGTIAPDFISSKPAGLILQYDSESIERSFQFKKGAELTTHDLQSMVSVVRDTDIHPIQLSSLKVNYASIEFEVSWKGYDDEKPSQYWLYVHSERPEYWMHLLSAFCEVCSVKSFEDYFFFDKKNAFIKLDRFGRFQFEFDQPLEYQDLGLKVNCFPVLNQFGVDIDPLTVKPGKMQYPVSANTHMKNVELLKLNNLSIQSCKFYQADQAVNLLEPIAKDIVLKASGLAFQSDLPELKNFKDELGYQYRVLSQAACAVPNENTMDYLSLVTLFCDFSKNLLQLDLLKNYLHQLDLLDVRSVIINSIEGLTHQISHTLKSGVYIEELKIFVRVSGQYVAYEQAWQLCRYLQFLFRRCFRYKYEVAVCLDYKKVSV